MVSGLSVVGAAYLIRLILSHELGLEAAGLYASAWTLGGLYVGYILQVMGTDFYPQLVSVVDDDEKCRRLVNDQAQVSMLLAGPGIIATLTLAPIVISLFYSSKFGGAVDVLRWICLGMGLRVVTWPMGFVLVAKNKQALFLFSDFAWACVNLGLAWLLVDRLGLTAAGIAFFGAYLFNALMLYPIIRSLCGFRWSAANRRVGGVFFLIIAIAFGGLNLLPNMPATVLGVVATICAALFSLRELSRLISSDHLPLKVRRLLERLRLVRPEARC
jgi:enterobacterial common antigen flippase